MITLSVLLFFVIAFLVYIFYAPFFLEINSVTGLFRLRFHHFASLNLLLKDETIIMEVKILWWRRYVDLLQVNFFAQKKLTKKVKKKNLNISLKKIKALLKCFKINEFNVSICFSDMTVNGILFPAFYLFGLYLKKKIAINFIEENKIILVLENNLARMSWAYFSS
jgi:hypothetical protein